MEIIKYSKKYEKSLFDLMKKEGEAWKCYYNSRDIEKYEKSLLNSITYIALENNNVIGFSRSLNDGDLYIYICDLLVDKDYRNKGIGQKLMEILCETYPDTTVYVMSDVDSFYEKKGYIKEGTIFEVRLAQK